MAVGYKLKEKYKNWLGYYFFDVVLLRRMSVICDLPARYLVVTKNMGKLYEYKLIHILLKSGQY